MTILKFLTVAALAVLPLSITAHAQGPISFGVRGGLPLTDLIEADDMSPVFSDTRMYTVGPTIAVNFPAGISIQADALYKRFSFGRPQDFIGDFPAADTSGNSWEFPVLLKWTGPGTVAPFVNSGAAFRNWSSYDQLGGFITGQETNDIDDRNNIGFVVGGGLTLKLGGLHISPELRYTRWGIQNFSEGVRTVLESNKNQAEVLVGFTF